MAAGAEAALDAFAPILITSSHIHCVRLNLEGRREIELDLTDKDSDEVL